MTAKRWCPGELQQHRHCYCVDCVCSIITQIIHKKKKKQSIYIHIFPLLSIKKTFCTFDPMNFWWRCRYTCNDKRKHAHISIAHTHPLATDYKRQKRRRNSIPSILFLAWFRKFPALPKHTRTHSHQMIILCYFIRLSYCFSRALPSHMFILFEKCIGVRTLKLRHISSHPPRIAFFEQISHLLLCCWCFYMCLITFSSCISFYFFFHFIRKSLVVLF